MESPACVFFSYDLAGTESEKEKYCRTFRTILPLLFLSYNIIILLLKLIYKGDINQINSLLS